MVGTEEHVENVLNLHRVFLSLLVDLEQELLSMTSQDAKLNARMLAVLEKVKA